MNQETRLFFDASVLIAAAHSPKGGSARLIQICQLDLLTAVTSICVINESERNLREHFPAGSLQRFDALLHEGDWIVLDVPSARLLAECAILVDDNDDAHVLASALASQADYLLTLDRKHLLTARLRSSGLPFRICTPGEFIQQYLPQHERYPLAS